MYLRYIYISQINPLYNLNTIFYVKSNSRKKKKKETNQVFEEPLWFVKFSKWRKLGTQNTIPALEEFTFW